MKTNLQRCKDIIRLATSYWISLEKLRTHTLVSRFTLDKIIAQDESLKDSTLETFMERWLGFVDDLQSKTMEIYKI
jgi:hypothetical protein